MYDDLSEAGGKRISGEDSLSAGIHQYHGKYLVYHTDFYKDF